MHAVSRLLFDIAPQWIKRLARGVSGDDPSDLAFNHLARFEDGTRLSDFRRGNKGAAVRVEGDESVERQPV